MADLVLRLRVDPVTGKRELVIDYTSDADALPIEHEQTHRELADRVVDGGLRSGKLDVAREVAAAAGEGDAATDRAGTGDVAVVPPRPTRG
jgi:hypothetical protein